MTPNPINGKKDYANIHPGGIYKGSNPAPPNNDLRESIFNILSGKELYGEVRFVVPEEMLDQAEALLKADRQRLLDKLLAAMPEKDHKPVVVGSYEYGVRQGRNDTLDQCRQIIEGTQ